MRCFDDERHSVIMVMISTYFPLNCKEGHLASSSFPPSSLQDTFGVQVGTAKKKIVQGELLSAQEMVRSWAIIGHELSMFVQFEMGESPFVHYLPSYSILNYDNPCTPVRRMWQMPISAVPPNRSYQYQRSVSDTHALVLEGTCWLYASKFLQGACDVHQGGLSLFHTMEICCENKEEVVDSGKCQPWHTTMHMLQYSFVTFTQHCDFLGRSNKKFHWEVMKLMKRHGCKPVWLWAILCSSKIINKSSDCMV